MAAKRHELTARPTGHPVVFAVPVLDEDGSAKNLDGLTPTCKAKDPSGNYITPSIAQRATGSNMLDITISGAQMTTGGASADNSGTPWKISVYVAGESGGELLEYAEYQMVAYTKETEA